jgi:hypothetical protein
MKFTTKDYKVAKLKNYIRSNNLFFFVNGVNFSSNDWIKTEQTLKNLNFNYYQVLNKVASKTLNNSIYNKIKPLVHGITFFIEFKTTFEIIEKKIIIKNLEPLLFTMLAIKFNTKIYSINQFKNLNSLDYSNNKLLLYQFLATNLKTYHNFSK